MTAKDELRRQAIARRAELHAAQPQAGAELVQRLLEILMPVRGIKIAGYMTLGDELDCGPTLSALHALGAQLSLPVAIAPEHELHFRTWEPGTALEGGLFGTQHPLSSAPLVEPDILLVPLVAFDATGHRLGYGAGFYDRTLAALRGRRDVLAIGLAYDGQEVPVITADESDQRLNAVVTESRVIAFDQ